MRAGSVACFGGMFLGDLRQFDGDELNCDLCIVGSGPAGLTLATELAHTRLRIVILESGAASSEPKTVKALNVIENVGASRQTDQTKVRNRRFGGTSHSWSGRCIEFDGIDFEDRDWIAGACWPIEEKTIRPYAARARSYLGLSLLPEDHHEDDSAGSDGVAANLSGLRPLTWQFSRRGDSALTEDYTRFGPEFRKLPAKVRENIQIWTRATVTHINTGADGERVESLEVADAAGRRIRVRAGRTVLCGGAIENARMMLASNRMNPDGVGNTYGLVGRCLIDHPRAVVGTFAPDDVTIIQRTYGLHRYPSGARTQRGWSLTPEVQRNERLVNCAAWATQHLAEDDVWRALRGIYRPYGRSRRELGGIALRHLDQIVNGVWTKLVKGNPLPRRWGNLDLEIMLEQEANTESRITLADRVDALGVPIPRVNWKIGQLEARTAIRLAKAVEEHLVRTHNTRPKLVDWVVNDRPEDAVFCDPAHPTGTTRISTNPRTGVVDANCKVFDLENLYVAGSSVFPTAGHANPTLMIVAMAIRLADHLKEKPLQHPQVHCSCTSELKHLATASAISDVRNEMTQ